MLSAGLMLRRLWAAIRFAAKEEGFVRVFGAAVILVILGTVTYSTSQGWNVADGFYFAVCTLTTSSISDPHLTITGEPIKLFTAFYVLTGIGILVELARQIGVAFIAMREERVAKHRKPGGDSAPGGD
ncbi:MAG TPA: ion channel [Thermoleophilaceae bacterium]